MKYFYLILVCLALSITKVQSFMIHHRHKNKGAKPMFQKIKKKELIRLRQKQLYSLEKKILQRRNKKAAKGSLLSRKLKLGVHISAKQQKGRELFLKKKPNSKVLKLKNTFVLRENQGMNIKGNIKKMKSLRKSGKHTHHFGFNNKIINRYLQSKIKKKFSFDHSSHLNNSPQERRLLDAKVKKAVKPESDSNLKFTKTKGEGVSGLNGGITYVERPKMTKPLYLNMSPVYDYRGY